MEGRTDFGGRMPSGEAGGKKKINRKLYPTFVFRVYSNTHTFQLKEVLDDRRICQVGISDLANPRGPENMGERFDQDQTFVIRNLYRGH